jgi:ribonuclease R
MKRARYAPLFTTHFGLMSPAYTHFTSPIRRYPDLMAHRLLKYQLAEDAASRPRPLAWSEAQSQGPANDFQPEPSSSYESMTAQLPWICAHCSDQEREAEQASYEALALKLCEYLAPQTGQHFSGIITGVNSYGFYVREDTTTAEGFVEREGLADAYEYDPAHHRYVDPNTTTHYRLGQRIPLTLKSVDTSKSTLIFETG